MNPNLNKIEGAEKALGEAVATGEKAGMKMDIATIMAMVDAALAFLETAVPRVKEAFKSGDVSVEQQKAMSDRFDKLRLNPGFTRPSER